jgi:tRNA threonylcarbamoyladenosine biosynthesis protein TsaB
VIRLLGDPVLGLETTGTLSGAALFLEGRLAGEITLDTRRSGSESLLESVRSLLAFHAIRIGDLRRIGVSLGPGSFTGVRIGLAAARALAVGAGIPLVGVPSHQAIAWSRRDWGEGIVLLTGVRRGQVFFEAGVWEDDTWRVESPARSLAVSEVPAAAAALSRAGQLLFLGEGVESVCEACSALRRLGTAAIEPLAWVRRPGAVARLAARAAAEEHRGAELERITPLYLRGADARLPASGGGPIAAG